MKRLAILGSGDLGRQVAHYAIADNHYDEVVFLDDFTTESKIGGIKVIGKSSDAIKLYQDGLFDELIIAIGYHHLQKKREIFESLSGRIPFGKIVHSTTFVDPTAEIGEGCVIYPNCSIDIRSKIGEYDPQQRLHDCPRQPHWRAQLSFTASCHCRVCIDRRTLQYRNQCDDNRQHQDRRWNSIGRRNRGNKGSACRRIVRRKPASVH